VGADGHDESGASKKKTKKKLRRGELLLRFFLQGEHGKYGAL
jgi:hypothetical protein